MAIKVRLPNARYIKVDTDDPEYAKERAIQYVKDGKNGFVDQTTRRLAIQFDKNNFDYETGVAAPWLRAKLGATENLAEKEAVLTDAVGGEGFTRNSKGDLALTRRGLKKLGINPTSNKNVVIDSNNIFEFGDFADFAGIVGPVLGSIAGSIFTRGKLKPKFRNLKYTTPAQIGYISAGTGIGAAAGKATEEGIEYVAGLQRNTPEELADLLMKEAAIGAAGEAIFGFGGKILKHTFGQKAVSKGELGAEDLRMAAALSRKGITDSLTGKTYKGAVAIAALDSPLTGLLQGITETVSKYKGRTIGVRDSLITETNNLVRSTNDLSSSFSSSIDDVIKSGYGDSSADLAAGKGIGSSLSKTFDDLNTKLDKANNNLKSTNDGILAEFDAFSEPATAEAGEQIRVLTADSYAAWYDAQTKIYDEMGRFFEIPRNISDSLRATKTAGKPGLGIQAKFIDSEPLKDYVDIITQNAVDASRKLDPSKAGVQLADFQKLLNNTEKNFSLPELLELRSGLASANRITEVGKDFATLSSVERSRMLDIIDETLNTLENGDSFAADSLQRFFTKNLDESKDAIDNIIPGQIKELQDLSEANLGQLASLADSEGKVAALKLLDMQTSAFKAKVKTLTDELDPLMKELYQAEINEAKQEFSNILAKINPIKTNLDNLANDSDFISPLQGVKQLERDAAYHAKVVDDIENKAFKNNKIDSKKIKAQMKSIKIANKFYSSGMQSFEQATLKSIMDDALAGGHNTDKILTNVILKNNNGEEVKRFLDSLDVDTSSFQKQRYKKIIDGKEVSTGRVDRSKAPVRESLGFTNQERKILKDADIKVNELTFQNADEVQGILQREFIRHIVKTTQKNGNVTNYRQIANVIEGYGTTGDVLFGSTKKSELLKSLRQADDLINIEDISEIKGILNNTSNVDHFIDDLNAKFTAQAKIAEISKLEIFNKIKNGSMDSENIVNAIFKAGNSEDIIKVKELLGPESIEFKEFQVAAMRKMLSDYVKPGDDVIEKLFDDGKFYDAVMSPNGYGQPVLKETFGDEQYMLLKEAAKRAKFAVGGERAAGGGGLFTQGFMFKVLSAPTQMMGKFSGLRFLAFALGSKRFLRWLTGDIANQQIIKEMPEILEKMGYYRGLNFEDSITGFRAGQPIRRSIGIQIPAENTRESNQYLQRQYENKLIDPKAPIAMTPLELPEVTSANLGAQNQAPMSRSLLGGNPANEEIFDRRNQIDQNLQGLA